MSKQDVMTQDLTVTLPETTAPAGTRLEARWETDPARRGLRMVWRPVAVTPVVPRQLPR